MRRSILLVAAASVCFAAHSAHADMVQGIDMDFVSIGNAGNAPDTRIMIDGTTGYGVVGAFWFVTIMIHIAFTIAVQRDAAALNRKGTGTIYVSPIVWSLSVLIGGVFLAAIYWIIHHSELRRTEPVPGNPGPYSWLPLEDGIYRKNKEVASSDTETSVNDLIDDS
jgi:hypothetical protein